ncbi:MAG: hypothetical protein R2880_04615 [Deinococcales bacterium]
MDRRQALTEEVVTVLVEDANGLRVMVSQGLKLNPDSLQQLSEAIKPQQAATISIGSEWIGPSQGLPDAPKNVRVC